MAFLGLFPGPVVECNVASRRSYGTCMLRMYQYPVRGTAATVAERLGGCQGPANIRCIA